MKLPTTSYAVMGLLSMAPMSGYALAQFADRSVAHFWPISKSQVYGELARLEELGYIAGTEVVQEKRPDKRTFSLTELGMTTLDEWVQAPGWERARFRSGFLVKVMFAHRMPRARFEEMLSEYREQVRAEIEDIRQIVDVLEGEPHAFFSRATALLGLRSTEAALRWADEIAAAIPAECPPLEPLNVPAEEAFRLLPERRKK